VASAAGAAVSTVSEGNCGIAAGTGDDAPAARGDAAHHHLLQALALRPAPRSNRAEQAGTEAKAEVNAEPAEDMDQS
jgi:hypothetical protein